MKKQLINEAFRLQALAGINPINSLNELGPDTYEDSQAVNSFLKKIMPALETLASRELIDEFKNLSPKLQDYALQMIRPQELLNILPQDYHVKN